jgi:hypothetical protein
MPLTNDELDQVLPLAFPMAPSCRSDFLEAIEHALSAHATRGPGLVHRLARDLQRGFLEPPRKSSPQFFTSRKNPR